MIKDEFIGNKTIMNPPMNKKLLSIQNILNVVISSKEPEKDFLLFKLLTLNLSSCLTEFILKIFINEFQKRKEDISNWKYNFINVLIKYEFETIIANTLLHILQEIKLSLLINFYTKADKINNRNEINLRKSSIFPMKCPKKMEIDNNYKDKKNSLELKSNKENKKEG